MCFFIFATTDLTYALNKLYYIALRGGGSNFEKQQKWVAATTFWACFVTKSCTKYKFQADFVRFYAPFFAQKKRAKDKRLWNKLVFNNLLL